MTYSTPETAPGQPDPGSTFEVEAFPDIIEPGSEVVLTALVPAEHAADLDGAFVIFLDGEGNELGRGALADSFSGMRRSEPVELVAPELPGPHRWSALLALPLGDDGELLGEVPFEVVVSAHPIALTIWDVPPAVEPGSGLRVKLGIKCPCGCDSAGWGWRIADETGAEVASGTVGEDLAPGTAGLHFTEVALRAPSEVGTRRWTVTALRPHCEIAHAERTLPLRVDVRPAADSTLQVETVDAVSGLPIERAKVSVQRHRAFTDGDGRAVLRLPRGRYTVFVSGKGYFAEKCTVKVAAEVTLRTELHVDREYSHADAWA